MKRAVAVLAAVMAVPVAAHAYRYTTCNGNAYRWADGDIDLRLMTCSAPAPSAKYDDAVYGFEEWNNAGGLPDVVRARDGDPNQCVVQTGNHISEVGFVDGDVIDGALGLTLRRFSGGCWSWSGRIDLIEADVFINGTTPLEEGNPAECNDKRLGQRTTILHELGHAIGLNHEDDAMALMLSTDGEGKYCGARMVEPHPDDVGGARRLYGTDGESRDLAASEFRLVAPDSVQLNSAPERVDRCPGEIHRVKWSVANLGTRDETYNVRWYLSTNRTITEFDRAIGTNINAVQVTGAFSTWERTVRIPWDMEPGEYFVGHLVDYDQRIWERRGSNNYTYMATRIRVLPSDDRRCQR